MSDTASVAPAVADAIDPIDALQLDDSNEMEPEVTLAPEMVMGGPPPDPKAAPETPATQPKAPETAPSSSQALPEGYTKDALGRIHGPDGRVLKKADADKLIADATASQQPTTPAKPEKFRYRSAGETKELDGFEYDPETGRVTISPEQVGILRDAMNARDVLAEGRDINAQLKAENAQLRQQMEHGQRIGTEEQARARALVEHYTQILSEPDEAKAIEQFFRLRADYPTLLAKAEANYYRQRAEAQARPAAPPSQREPQATEPTSTLPPREIAQQTTTEYVEQLKLDHALRDLSPENWKQLGDRYGRTPYAFLRPATAEEATQYGVAPGQIVFDTDAFRADVDEYVSTLRGARETAARQAKLAADNARKTQPSIDAPPVPGAGAPPTASPRGFKNAKDVEDWLNSDEL